MKEDVQQALKTAIPLSVAYFPAAVAFGVLSKSCNITLWECFLFSAVVFAGASQFIALNLLMTGMGASGIILTTLLVNFRHFLMSASLATRMANVANRYLAVIAFGVTDEVFSVLSFKRGSLSKTYIVTLQLSAYAGWVSGTLSGYILGDFLPDTVIKSMGVALYALLLAILLPGFKKSVKSLMLAVSAGLLNVILIELDALPSGWTIIVCIFIIASIGAFWENSGDRGETHG